MLWLSRCPPYRRARRQVAWLDVSVRNRRPSAPIAPYARRGVLAYFDQPIRRAFRVLGSDAENATNRTSRSFQRGILV